MKNNISVSRRAFLFALLVAASVGTYIGFLTARNAMLVNAFQSVANLYFIYLLLFKPKFFSNEPLGTRVFLKDFKYIVAGLLLSIIVYWSGLRMLIIVINLIKPFFK
jgi:hypothetical protein